MLQFDEYKVKLNNLTPALDELGQALDLDSAERELDMLQAESAADGFWDNLAKAQKVQARLLHARRSRIFPGRKFLPRTSRDPDCR